MALNTLAIQLAMEAVGTRAENLSQRKIKKVSHDKLKENLWNKPNYQP